jgi:archaellum component FlaD/FlaE
MAVAYDSIGWIGQDLNEAVIAFLTKTTTKGDYKMSGEIQTNKKNNGWTLVATFGNI